MPRLTAPTCVHGARYAMRCDAWPRSREPRAVKGGTVDNDTAMHTRAWRMANGATVADWLGTASTAASLGAMYLADVRSGVAGSGRLHDAREQLAQSLRECDAVIVRIGQDVDTPQAVARLERLSVQIVEDDSPDASWLEQSPKELGSITAAVANRRRLLALQRGDWALVGVRLVADVVIEQKGYTDRHIAITGAGIWGTESDSDRDYLRELALADWDQVKSELAALGLDIESVDPPGDLDIEGGC